MFVSHFFSQQATKKALDVIVGDDAEVVRKTFATLFDCDADFVGLCVVRRRRRRSALRSASKRTTTQRVRLSPFALPFCNHIVGLGSLFCAAVPVRKAPRRAAADSAKKGSALSIVLSFVAVFF